MFFKTWLKLATTFTIFSKCLVLATTCVFNQETRDFSIFFKDKSFRVQISKDENSVPTVTIPTTTKSIPPTTVSTPDTPNPCPEEYQHFDDISKQCINNACNCKNGRAIHFTKCLKNGSNNCKKCNSGYERAQVLEGVFQCINQDGPCSCSNGRVNSNCTNGGESCESCFFGYKLWEMDGILKCIPEFYNTTCTTGVTNHDYEHGVYIQSSHNYLGNCDVLEAPISDVSDWRTCRQHCNENNECVAFVYEINPKRCSLKNAECGKAVASYRYTTVGVKNCCGDLKLSEYESDELNKRIFVENGVCKCDESAAYIDENGDCQLKRCFCDEDGIGAVGVECPEHNTHKCVYSGVFETLHPYEKHQKRVWSLNVPRNKKAKVSFDRFELYSRCPLSLSCGSDALIIQIDGNIYQFEADENSWNDNRVSNENQQGSGRNHKAGLLSYDRFREKTNPKDFSFCTSNDVDFLFVAMYYSHSGYYGFKINWEFVDFCE